MRYSTDQHRLDVQRLSDDAEKERKAIEDKLFQLRESDVLRRKLKEQDDNLNFKNQNQNQNLNYNQNNYSNQHQYPQQQQQQQQHQYPNNYHNNYLNNYENNFQIMEQSNGPNRQLHLQQHITHTSSSSKSNSSNNHNHPYPNPHERYVGMIKSESKSGKTKKLKSVVEVTRKIIKKSK